LLVHESASSTARVTVPPATLGSDCDALVASTRVKSINLERRLAQPFAGPIRLRSMMAVMQLPRRGRTRVEFERFVDTCAGELLRTGYLIVWDLEEAEELVQETLLRRIAQRKQASLNQPSRDTLGPRPFATMATAQTTASGSASASRWPESGCSPPQSR